MRLRAKKSDSYLTMRRDEGAKLQAGSLQVLQDFGWRTNSRSGGVRCYYGGSVAATAAEILGGKRVGYNFYEHV